MCFRFFRYEYWFIKPLSMFIRTGDGYSYAQFTLKYRNGTDLVRSSHDPFYAAGIGIGVKPFPFGYIEAGIQWQHVLHKHTNTGGLFPELSAGFRY